MFLTAAHSCYRANRRAFRESRKQLSKTANSGRHDVQAAYRQLYFADADEVHTIKDDDWRT
jgi:hypothetical protein